MVSTPVAEGVKQFTGLERRRSRRLAAKYPVCMSFISPHGEKIERYGETRDVSSEGVLLTCTGSLPSGTNVEMQIAVPSAFVESLPGAQLNVSAEVVRSAPLGVTAENIYETMVALKFLEKPRITTHITMFD